MVVFPLSCRCLEPRVAKHTVLQLNLESCDLTSKVPCDDPSRKENVASETKFQIKLRSPLKMSLPPDAEVLNSPKDVGERLRTSQLSSHGLLEYAHQD